MTKLKQQQEEIRMTELPRQKLTFTALAYNRAVSANLIDEGNPKMELCKRPRVRVTEWYTDGDGWMLERAIKQFAGCHTLLVYLDEGTIRKIESGCEDAPRVCKVGDIAIYRSRGDCKLLEELESEMEEVAA